MGSQELAERWSMPRVQAANSKSLLMNCFVSCREAKPLSPLPVPRTIDRGAKSTYDDSSEPPLHYWASVRDIRLTRKLSSSATVRRRCQRCRLSPDGRRAAISRDAPGGADLWLLEVQRSVFSRFTFHPGTNGFPVWS